MIDSVDIRLRGFTAEELKDIIGYIRSVEAHRPSRLVHVKLDTPDLTVEEASRLVLDLWPDEVPPRYMALMKRVKKDEAPRQ